MVQIHKNNLKKRVFLFFLTGYIVFTIPIFAERDCQQAYLTRSRVYGDIIDQNREHVGNSIIERVEIYAQRTENSNDRIVRNGILVRNKSAQATILLAHGFMCDKYYGGFLRNVFPRDQFNFITFDFRAHGENIEGQYCTFGQDEAYDVIAAAKFIKSLPDLAGKPLFVYGFSMGAVASIAAQAKEPGLFDAMILDCPFDTSENVIRNGLAGMKVGVFGYEFEVPGKQFIEKYAFHPYVQTLVKFALKFSSNMDSKNIQIQILPISSVNSIKKVTVPCFFIHCRNDEKVPVNAVKSIYDSAAGYKKLWITNGRGHCDSFFYSPEHYASHVQQFLAEVLNGKMSAESKSLIIEDIDYYALKKG